MSMFPLLARVSTGEWMTPGEALVDDRTEGVDVRRRPGALRILPTLGGSVGASSVGATGDRAASVFDPLGDPEVEQRRDELALALPDHDVRRLEVAVDDENLVGFV